MLFKTAFTRCRHILKAVKNSTDRPSVHTKTAHFCRQILKTVDFEDGTLTGKFRKRHRVNIWKWRKQNIFSRFWNDTDRFLGCRYTSLASKPCNEFSLSNFLPFSNCSGIVWTLAQTLQPSHFSPFSICAGIVWTLSKLTNGVQSSLMIEINQSGLTWPCANHWNKPISLLLLTWTFRMAFPIVQINQTISVLLSKLSYFLFWLGCLEKLFLTNCNNYFQTNLASKLFICFHMASQQRKWLICEHGQWQKHCKHFQWPQKAFDTVDRNILLANLRKHSVENLEITWFT